MNRFCYASERSAFPPRAPPVKNIQVSFGLLSLLDSPLFHIYVLGRKAEGNLARPFKKQGLMASLSGPMEAMAAKVRETGARREERRHSSVVRCDVAVRCGAVPCV